MDCTQHHCRIDCWIPCRTSLVLLPIREGHELVKFVESMSNEVRERAATNVVVLEGAVALVQVVSAMITGNIGNWFAAMLAITLGAIAWVILTPDEEDANG